MSAAELSRLLFESREQIEIMHYSSCQGFEGGT